MAPSGAVPEPPAVPPESSVAEMLPRLYRRVLDAVAQLEDLGGRADAARFRQLAITTYSGSWNSAGQRRLEDVLARTETAARALERRGAPLEVA